MKYMWLLFALGTGLPILYATYLKRKLDVALRMLEDTKTRQRSISASYGRITEQWFPIMDRYPYDSANFRFLGTPIDGIQFEDDKVVLVEFKSRKAELSAVQRKIKQLVQSGKVTWEEFHFFDEIRE